MLYCVPLQCFSVLDIGFHIRHPDNLFSCSMDGALFHWDGSQSRIQTTTQRGLENSSMASDTGGPWLSGAVARGKIDICNLLPSNSMPVNSLDVEANAGHVIAVTDEESLFVVPELQLR